MISADMGMEFLCGVKGLGKGVGIGSYVKEGFLQK